MMAQVSEAYQPFMRDLKELQTYLVNDSTPAAVSAASGFFQKTTASGQTLTTRLDALVAEVNSLAAELAPKIQFHALREHAGRVFQSGLSG